MNNRSLVRVCFALLLGLAALVPRLSCAQATWAPPVPVPGAASAAPPVPLERVERVGRVAAISGAAQLWDAQDRQWIPLQPNRLVTEGDRLRSEAQARVEIQVGTLALWMGPSSDVDVLRLDTQAALLRLNQGHLVARVRTSEWASSLQVLTGELVAQPLAPGLYRVDRDTVSGGRSAAATLRGLLSVNAVDARLQLAGGQRLEVMGSQAGGGLRNTVLLSDAFATWVQARDQMPDDPVSAAAAPWREVTGLETLERYGRWERHPDEGWIWSPHAVRPGWEPFREGRWVWAYPWGWTWLDDAPWGFAPSHFGRWIYWNSRWVWAPGAARIRPLPPNTAPPWVPEHRTERKPRPEPGEPGLHRPLPPGGAGLPGGVHNPLLPGLDERPLRPDRRHGIERPTREPMPTDPAGERRSDRPVDRVIERPVERPVDRPPPALRPERGEPVRSPPKPLDPRPADRPSSDKPDRPDRSRQLAQ